MAGANEKQRVLTRRAFFLGGVQLLACTALAGRLYYLQFLRSDEYTTLAENNRIKLMLMAPERGRILDKLGNPLAVNEKNYQLFMDASSLPKRDIEPLLNRIAGLIALTPKRITQLTQEFKTNPFNPLLVKEHLEWEEVARLELNQLQLPGCYIQVGQVRYYPDGQVFAHVLGYVGAVAKEEMNDRQPLLKLPDFKIGKSGAEKMLEDELRGSAGIRQVEVDVHGLHVRELGSKPSVPGENMRLTLHGDLQRYAAERMGEESGSVIVMDAENGDILTLAAMPAFDPNIFSKGIPKEYWNELHGSLRHPLINKAIQGLYPPGSTFKMMTGLAGLKSGAATPETRVFCPGHFFLGAHRFNCWKEGGHGTVNLHSAIAVSCDTYFYTIAQRMGIEPLTDICRRFGLGEVYDIGIIGQKAGLVPDPAWKQKRYKQRWTTGDTINAAIGQGYVLATPFQLAVMTARLATGLNVRPRLADNGVTPDFTALNVNNDMLDAIRAGMNAVTNEAIGTAYSKRIMDPAMAMAGKTGTAQVRKILVRGQDQSKIPWEFRHHALFVGYAPVSQPKYVVSVAIEHGGGGASTAAPIARDVLQKAQEIKA